MHSAASLLGMSVHTLAPSQHIVCTAWHSASASKNHDVITPVVYVLAGPGATHVGNMMILLVATVFLAAQWQLIN